MFFYTVLLLGFCFSYRTFNPCQFSKSLWVYFLQLKRTWFITFYFAMLLVIDLVILFFSLNRFGPGRVRHLKRRILIRWCHIATHGKWFTPIDYLAPTLRGYLHFKKSVKVIVIAKRFISGSDVLLVNVNHPYYFYNNNMASETYLSLLLTSFLPI